METLPNPELYIESGNAKRRPVRVHVYHKTYNRRTCFDSRQEQEILVVSRSVQKRLWGPPSLAVSGFYLQIKRDGVMLTSYLHAVQRSRGPCTFVACKEATVSLFFYFHSHLFIPYFFSLYFLLLIAISVSVGVLFGTPSRLKLIVSDLRHVKAKNFAR